jgi:hypothetical protein
MSQHPTFLTRDDPLAAIERVALALQFVAEMYPPDYEPERSRLSDGRALSAFAGLLAQQLDHACAALLNACPPETA